MELTGEWYLKKRLFEHYVVMVEVITTHTSQKYYKVASQEDIHKVGICCAKKNIHKQK